MNAEDAEEQRETHRRAIVLDAKRPSGRASPRGLVGWSAAVNFDNKTLKVYTLMGQARRGNRCLAGAMCAGQREHAGAESCARAPVWRHVGRAPSKHVGVGHGKSGSG